MATPSPLEQAAQLRFESSTTPELKDFLIELGESFDDTDSQSKLRAKVLAAMGLVDVSGQANRQRQTAAVSSGEAIRPPYNLSPNGLWGGRRHRIRLPRPEGAKIGRAEGINWNGKATYWLAYDSVEAVPEPIYNILTDRRRKIVSQEKIKNPDGSEEIHTKWEFTDMALVYQGVDPLTADRAGSLTEWYQLKGPGWFEKRNTRQLQSIAGLLEISINKGDAIKSAKSDEELRGDIFVFLYGYADVKDAEKAEA